MEIQTFIEHKVSKQANNINYRSNNIKQREKNVNLRSYHLCALLLCALDFTKSFVTHKIYYMFIV